MSELESWALVYHDMLNLSGMSDDHRLKSVRVHRYLNRRTEGDTVSRAQGEVTIQTIVSVASEQGEHPSLGVLHVLSDVP